VLSFRTRVGSGLADTILVIVAAMYIGTLGIIVAVPLLAKAAGCMPGVRVRHCRAASRALLPSRRALRVLNRELAREIAQASTLALL